MPKLKRRRAGNGAGAGRACALASAAPALALALAWAAGGRKGKCVSLALRGPFLASLKSHIVVGVVGAAGSCSDVHAFSCDSFLLPELRSALAGHTNKRKKRAIVDENVGRRSGRLAAGL